MVFRKVAQLVVQQIKMFKLKIYTENQNKVNWFF